MADVSRLPVPLVAHWDWQRHAACRDLNLEMFFHPDGERGTWRRDRIAAARAVCDRCPVQPECLAWARSTREPYGMWGGESEEERREALARHHSPPPGDRPEGTRPAA